MHYCLVFSSLNLLIKSYGKNEFLMYFIRGALTVLIFVLRMILEIGKGILLATEDAPPIDGYLQYNCCGLLRTSNSWGSLEEQLRKGIY